MESILTSIKKLLGIAETDTNFDVDVIMHINSAFSDLNDIGVGPAEGFSITDSEAQWTDFISESMMPMFEDVKTFVYMKVKLAFDPPLSSSVLASMERELAKREWKLNARAETVDFDEEV